MTFKLHPCLAQKSLVCNLPLCSVLLENDKYYPWLILVPRRPELKNFLDMQEEDLAQVGKELMLSQKILYKHFHPHQINVAALGNKTAQLHIHVIGRYETDPAWPQTVWDHPVKKAYQPLELNHLIQTLAFAFEQTCT